MKAIETVYNGYKFRSRLEARWAVFFDTLGIKYEYEKEGYVLNNGVHYLPDFWLSELQRWIEIKGQEPTREECDKLCMLAQDTSYPSCIFYGLPGENKGMAYYTCAHESNAGSSETEELEWSICPLCLSVDVTLRDKSECSLYREVEGELYNSCIYVNGTDCLDKLHDFAISARNMISKEALEYGRIERIWANLGLAKYFVRWAFGEEDISSKTHPRLIAAYTAARQAQFEHGKKGTS